MSKKDKDAESRTFVQTAAAELADLDRWRQVGEEEARVAYEMTVRNELSGGTPTVRRFEARWRELTGRRYAITTFNGTAALYSAFFGLGIGPGDEVICPGYTWIGAISPAPLLGARPVFVDCAPGHFNVDPEDIRRKITSRTKAVVVVHMWGWPADMDAVMEISREYGVPVVEDCSHAHGAMYKGRPVGSIGHVGCWSFQGTKAVSAGEGGVIATDDEDVFERACLLGQVNRLAGVDLVTERYAHLQPLGVGMKLRAHPVGIGIAEVQLGKLPRLNERRGEYVRRVEEGLAGIEGLSPFPVVEGGRRGGFYGFPILFEPEAAGCSRGELLAAMREEGLPASPPPYPLLHLLPYFAEGFDLFPGKPGPLSGDYKGYRAGDLPVAERLHEWMIHLPVMSDPVDGAAERVVDMIRSAVRRARGGRG